MHLPAFKTINEYIYICTYIRVYTYIYVDIINYIYVPAFNDDKTASTNRADNRTLSILT
jgi:hypothetical protein